MSYFIKRGDKVQGPFTRQQLMGFAKHKKVTGADLVGSSAQGPFQELNTVWDSINKPPAATASSDPVGQSTEPVLDSPWVSMPVVQEQVNTPVIDAAGSAAFQPHPQPAPQIPPPVSRNSHHVSPSSGPAIQTERTISAVYTMTGVQDELNVFKDMVTITPKGVLGFLNKGFKGTKEIPFTSIVAVQIKEAGALFSGYLQFTIPGGNESRGGLLSATKDENTFMFAHAKNNAMAREIKEYIANGMREVRTPQVATPTTSLADELQKLAQLREHGALSEDEFQAAKRKLIG